jgi:hypothetical protein
VNRSRISDPKTPADVEDNYRKTIGQLLGVAAVLIGRPTTYSPHPRCKVRDGCSDLLDNTGAFQPQVTGIDRRRGGFLVTWSSRRCRKARCRQASEQ